MSSNVFRLIYSLAGNGLRNLFQAMKMMATHRIYQLIIKGHCTSSKIDIPGALKFPVKESS